MKTFSLVVVLFIAALATLHAQSDTITANPKAVMLHRIWYVHGHPAGGSYVGDAIGAVGDVNGDGIDDFAIHYGGEELWKIFYGASPKPADTPTWQYHLYATQPQYPVIGDFWGTGQKAVVFGERVQIHGCCDRCLLTIFKTDGGLIETIPSIKQDTLKLPGTDTWLFVEQLVVADLDGDGTDELIATGISPSGGAIWIYRGGPGFQVDTPAVVIDDADEAKNNDPGLRIIASDFDRDGHPDMISGGHYLSGEKMKFYWGGPGSPWNWNSPDRVIVHDTTMPGFDNGFGLIGYDSDGDKIPDIQVGYQCIFRSRTGKDIRTRSFTYADVDNRLPSKSIWLRTPVGFLNDSTRKYEMTGAISADLGLVAFSGSDIGPSLKYDATYNSESDIGEGALFLGSPLGDVSGDGWPDYLTASSAGNGLSDGAAVVLAGGPYIPRDSLMSAIRDYEVQGKARAISVWPMPAHDEAHIAWRGDLPQMPTRLEVYNALGQRVAGGIITEEKGEALWRCDNISAGYYFVALFARNGALIITMPICKQ